MSAPTGDDCVVGADCGGPDADATCISVRRGVQACVPNGTLLCCMSNTDCPDESGFGGGQCISAAGPGTGLCLDPFNDYCISGGTLPTAEDIGACHSDGATRFLDYDYGDCDGDGISNGDEIVEDTDLCLASPPLGIWTGSECGQLDVNCLPDVECTTPTGGAGDCDTTDDGGGQMCVPRRDELFCLGSTAWICPPDTLEVVDRTRSQKWCVPDACTEARFGLELLDCVISPGGEPSPWDGGDCDNDGIPNAAEEDDRICVSDLPPMDAGVPSDDAGVPSDEAGVPSDDAGMPSDDAGAFDASTQGGDGGTAPDRQVPVSFGGGSGCVCRASPARGTAPGWLLALGALALIRRRR